MTWRSPLLLLTALRVLCLVLRAPYALRWRHAWRKPAIDRSGLWPTVTLGCFSWDLVSDPLGKQLTEMLDTTRTRPPAGGPQ